MANRQGKSIDKTYLSIDNAEGRGFIHRDYIAHCLRWSFVVKDMMKKSAYKTARVLDVGCGKEAPLAKLLYSSKMFPAEYIGVDAGKIEPPSLGKYEEDAMFIDQVDFARDPGTDTLGFDRIVCFEVLEHIEPEHVVRMLKKIYGALVDGGVAYISTPCWNRTACAGNHVNEMTHEVLAAVIEACGFYVSGNWGTFASQSEIMPAMTQEHLDVMNDLRDYYDSNLLSCIFAPMYPEASRNSLWRLTKNDGKAAQYDELKACQEPWSSSEHWQDFAAALD